MTNEELDHARAEEAFEQSKAGDLFTDIASHAARLSREAQEAEIDRLLGILKRVTPDSLWGEDPKVTAFYKEAREVLQLKKDVA